MGMVHGEPILFHIPNEWMVDFKDGIEFCHLEPSPMDHFQNFPCDTQEGKLLNWKKIFKASFWDYIEKVFLDLITPRFSTVKTLVPSDITTIRGCKRNGSNATVWVHSFMLPTLEDIDNFVVK